MHELTWIIIRISLTFKAHSCDGIISRNTSGSGLYILRSGNRSWTRDKDTVAKVIFAAKITNAEIRNEKENSVKFATISALKIINIELKNKLSEMKPIRRSKCEISVRTNLLNQCLPLKPMRPIHE